MDVSPGCLGRVGVLVLVVVFGDAKVGRVVVFDEVGGAALAVCVAVPKAVVGVLGEFISVRDNSLAFARSTFKAVAGEATGVFVAVAVAFFAARGTLALFGGRRRCANEIERLAVVGQLFDAVVHLSSKP